MHYKVEIEILSHNPEIFCAVAYSVDGTTRQRRKTIGKTTQRERVEAWAQDLRDEFIAEGHQLKRFYVTRIGISTQVIAERLDGSCQCLFQSENTPLVARWLDQQGFVRLTRDECAIRWPEHHPLDGDWTREHSPGTT